MSLIVTTEHMRAAELCVRGSRNFFRSAGLDWDDFIRNGIDAEKLTATGNPFALKAVAIAQKEAANG